MPGKDKHTFAELNSWRNHLKWILACNNERELTQIFRKNGKDEDPRFAKIVKLFRGQRTREDLMADLRISARMAFALERGKVAS